MSDYVSQRQRGQQGEGAPVVINNDGSITLCQSNGDAVRIARATGGLAFEQRPSGDQWPLGRGH